MGWVCDVKRSVQRTTKAYALPHSKLRPRAVGFPERGSSGQRTQRSFIQVCARDGPTRAYREEPPQAATTVRGGHCPLGQNTPPGAYHVRRFGRNSGSRKLTDPPNIQGQQRALGGYSTKGKTEEVVCPRFCGQRLAKNA